MSKYSKKAEKVIGSKMHKMKGEDKPQKQKVAIALSEAREKGLKVPKKKEGEGSSSEANSMDRAGGAKVPPEKKEGYHGHEGTDHSHLSNQNLRGSNKAHATKTVNLQTNHECYEDAAKGYSPEKHAPKEDKYIKERRTHDDHDSKMGPKKK